MNCKLKASAEMQTNEEDIVVDACTLANARAADVILRLVALGVHRVHWSEQILEETRRTQLGDLSWKPRIVESYHRRLREAFPEAVVRGHERWIAQCTNDEGDRHVLACAIEAQARYIVTFNERHFKDADLARWDVRALTPNDYLWMLYLRDEGALQQQLSRVADKKEVSLRSLLEGLLRDCKSFAERLLSELP